MHGNDNHQIPRGRYLLGGREADGMRGEGHEILELCPKLFSSFKEQLPEANVAKG